MTFTDAQLLGWMEMLFWPLTRVAGLLAIAPVLGARTVPRPIRVVLALLITLVLLPVLLPVLPPMPVIALFSPAWWLETLHELVLGVVMGFVVMVVFEAVVLGGELIAYGMGLSFAQLVDPLRGAGTPVVGQMLLVLATLMFLSLQGHLRLIEALAMSFQRLPVGDSALNVEALHSLVLWGGQIFSAGMQIALPVMMALLLANLAFGVMSRSAPALSAMSVGFPISLAAGLLLLRYSLPGLQSVFSQTLDAAYAFLTTLMPLANE